ncbi:hypothetical protein [Candidatus Uabimicrobium sp. HlEnr_7]|uniref:hypothetical protein n=1 Tax=Candidatus Uabimicrobium helgolandensis TaxID=3095367 RepID=UPI0035563A4E
MKKNICIIGNNGKEFHLYNLYYRKNKNVAFFASQHATNHCLYPLAGRLYPEGIPILPLDTLELHIKKHNITDAVFAGSNVTFEYLSLLGKKFFRCGIELRYSPIKRIMLDSNKKTIAICNAIPQTKNEYHISLIAKTIYEQKKKLSWIFLPYCYSSFYTNHISINRPNSFFPPILQRIQSLFYKLKHNVLVGNNFEAVIREGEKQGDIILVTPPGNDFPLVKPDLYICIVSKQDNFMYHYPGRINVEMANIIIIDDESQIQKIRIVNPQAQIIFKSIEQQLSQILRNFIDA